MRKEKNIPLRDQLELKILYNSGTLESMYPVISRLGNIGAIEAVTSKPDGVVSFRIGADEYFVPAGNLVDVAGEIAKLKKELEYTEGFLKSVRGKLSNERFMSNAPESVVAVEKKKEADALARIDTLKESLASLEK